MKYLCSIGLAAVFALCAGHSAIAFELLVQKVADNTYALVGSINARSKANQALNATMGFVVSDDGVILIDSGASSGGAKIIETAISGVTNQPVKWVINTGAQDHRWLGNGYFAAKGAKIIALQRTVASQKEYARAHMQRLKNVVKLDLSDSNPVFASMALSANDNEFTLGGVNLRILWPGGAHFPDDGIVWMPATKTVFTGDLVFMDRMLGIQSDGASVVSDWAGAFKTMAALNPAHVVPGHGTPGDLAKARRDTGDYLDWLLAHIAPEVDNMEDIGVVVNKLATSPFQHLKHYDVWHKKNVNLTYLQLEADE